MLKEGGFKKQIAGFNVERIGNAARSLALGRYAYERAREWAMQRKQFGRLLCEFQGLQWKFAEMKTKLDAGQLLLYRAAANADRGFPSAEETAIAKVFCNQSGFEVANEALQVMGGLGYSQEELVEYCVRRCRGWMIAGGSIEILKNRIAEGVCRAQLLAAAGKGVKREADRSQAGSRLPVSPKTELQAAQEIEDVLRVLSPRASKVLITRLASDGPNWRFPKLL